MMLQPVGARSLSNSMQAAHYVGERRFELHASVPIPPGPGEVRLDVGYVGICGTDMHIFHGAMDARVRPPQIIGHEMSGTVAEVGAGVEGLKQGDAVVVRPLDSRGEVAADRGLSHICRDLKFLGIDLPGAYQNSWTVPAFTVHKAPDGIDLRLAALAEPLAVACHDVRLGEIRAGEFAVVIGGGPIGMLIALVAAAKGARILISEVNESRLSLARELGFESVNPLRVDLPQLCRERTGGSGADVVLEVSGARASVASMTGLLALRGRVVLVAIHPKPVEINLFHFFWKELRLVGARVYEPEDYEQALTLIAERRFPLESLISRIEPLCNLQAVFEELDGDSSVMKVLIDCRTGEGTIAERA